MESSETTVGLTKSIVWLSKATGSCKNLQWLSKSSEDRVYSDVIRIYSIVESAVGFSVDSRVVSLL